MKHFFFNKGSVKQCLHVLLLLSFLVPGLSAATTKNNTPPPPTWTINPDDFEFNMNMVVRANFNGVSSNAAGNLVGVFVGNELRGVAAPLFISGNAYFFITVYSNDYTGETLHFRVYYAPNDAVYSTPESLTFTHNLSVGIAEDPFFINIDPNADFPPELEPLLADTTLLGIPFEPVDLNDYLVNLDGDPVTWSAQPGPNLSAVVVNGVLTVTPLSPLWTGTDSVRIIVTENTANQLADTITGWFTVLPDYGAPVWQNIPDQTIFQGGAFTAFDLDDYLSFAGDCRQFDFDVFPFTGSIADPAWPVVVPGATPMSVIARSLFADEQLAGPGAKLAAFVNGILAGWASPAGVSPNVTYSLLLKNVGAGPITFRFYDAENQYLYEEITSLVYVVGGSAGTMSSPFLIQLSPLVPSLSANGQFQISIDDPTWLGTYPIDFIVWDCRFPDLRRDTTQALYTITDDLRPQITSLATVNFEENACRAIYDTNSTDPTNSEGAGLTYSLAGGADAVRFLIDAVTGILNWAPGFSPDFETPADADANNQYQVNIIVTNVAGLSDTLALTVSITNQAIEPFSVSINGGAGVLCSNGTVTLLTSGGVSYTWSNGATTADIIVNAAGTYSVTATSSGACTASVSILLAPPATITAAGNNTPVCQGSNIQLSSTPAGGTLPYTTFAWSGPNGYTASVKDPAGIPAIPAAAGVYTVTLTDGAGCTATASKTISVAASAAPVISASSNTPVCSGSNLILSSTPSGGSGIYTQFSWAGPNSYAAITQNPAAFPAAAANGGTYTVKVTDNAGCTASASTTVIVKPLPVISAASNSPVCTGGTILLNATPSGGSGTFTTFQWSGPNSFSSVLEDPAGFPAILAASGTYTVTVTDNAGCTKSGTTSVSVSGLPTIMATLLGPVCTSGTVALGSTPTGGSGTYSAFQWSGPNGYSANVEDPAAFPVTPAVVGTYTVTVTDQGGCTASNSVSVSIHPLPTVTTANNGPVCQGASISLSSAASGGSGVFSAFLWTGPDNYVASLEDPAPFSSTVASAGIYQVKVTDSQGCSATATTTVVVKPKPSITASSNSPLCTGANLNLQSSPVGGSGVYTFSWTGPASYTASVEDPAGFAVSIANAGTYLVTVTDNAGCSATASTSVSISTLAAPSISASSNSPICGGHNLILTSTPSGGGGSYTAFSWGGPNSYTSTQEDPTPFPVFVSGNGIYTVTVTDNKNCKGTASVSVVVNGPVVAPTSNSPVCPGGTILLHAGGTGVSYAWAGPNNYSSSQANPPGFAATPATTGVYTVSVTDNNGCTNTGSVTVMVGDITPPVISCPANQTVSANASCSGVVGMYTALSVSDNCAANPTVTQSPVAATILSGHNDSEMVTLTASDGNGNTASCTFSVTLKDVTKPVIICPANTTVAADANCGGIVGTHAPITVSDNCSANLVVTQSPVAATVLSGHNDVETVTLTANDGNGNSQFCNFTVTLKDVTKPLISCPANTTLAADGNCSSPVGAYSAVTVSDNCNPNPVVTQSPAATTILNGHNDVEIITLTANDGNGNTQSCTFTVTLKDVTKPVIICPANATVAADGACSGVVGSYAPVSVSDNCNPNPVVMQSPAASTILSGHNDVETLTLTADDGNGNSQFCTFTVTLKDVTKPVIVCPANTTIAADANCSGIVGAYSALSVNDNCNPNPVVTQSPAASTVLSGHNDVETVTLTANDGNGNSQFCTFTVTLKDVTKPVITCPANTSVAADVNCSSPVGAYSAVSVSDNCTANPSVTQSPVATTVLNGHNDLEIITLTANDGNGNTEFCTFTVTLKDVTKPQITCPANTTLAADATCSSPVGAYTAVAVSDNCTLNPTVTQSPVASTLLTGHNDVKTITLTADDGNGNTQFCNFTVTLKDITAPTVVCKPFTAALNAAGTVGITTANVFQSGADNCGTVNQVSVIPNTFTCSNLGTNNVVLNVNDGNGNTASCNAVVTVVDLIPPTMLCKPLSVYLNAAGTATATAAQINNGSTDNCTLVSLALAPGTFTCANLGPNTVTLMGTDQSGNTATCQSVVTVIDTIKPTMLCKDATLNLNIAGQATLTVAAINNGSFDNCTIVSLTLSQTLFTCANLGSNNPVKLVGTDQSGNASFCTATVTVLDLIAPAAKCKNITANLGAAGTVGVLPSSVDNVSTDNCSFNLSLSPNTFTCANLGTNTVTLKATDGSGNTNTCTATVTVKDVTPPTALCKNLTIFLNDVGKATITPLQADNGSTDNCSISSRVLSRTQFDCADISTPVNDFLTLTDASGNTSVCTAVITVKDNLAPTAVCQNVTVALVNGSVTVYPSVLAGTSTDNCSVWSFSPAAKTYTSANLGPNNLLITVKDFSGNASTCTSVVTVLPNGPDPRPVDFTSDQILKGIASVKAKLKMGVYPNPTNGDVVLEFELPEDQDYLYQLCDFTGKIMLREKGAGMKGQNSVAVRMDNVSPGIYLLELHSGTLKAVMRLMVQK